MRNETNLARDWTKAARWTVSLIAVGLLANCSPPPPIEPPQAPPPEVINDTPPPKTLENQSGLLGGPPPGAAPAAGEKSDTLTRFTRSDGVKVVTMRPIPNPGEAAFGTRSAAPKSSHAAPRMAPESAARRAASQPTAKPAAAIVKPSAIKPAPLPPQQAKPLAPRPVAPPPAPMIKPAPPSIVVAKPEVPAAPVAVPKNVQLAAPTAPAPALSQKIRTIPALASTDPRLAGLQSDLLPTVTKGAVIVMTDGLAKGQGGVVTLTLPKSLYSEIRNKAAQHGVDRFAKKTILTATLVGDGYQISPKQAQSIELSDTKDSVYTWLVVPEPVNRGPLRANLSANLVGGPTALALPLAGLEPLGEAVPGDGVGADGKKPFQLPGLSPDTSKSVAIAGLLMVGVTALAFAARRANDERRAQDHRRRQRDSMIFASPSPEAPKADAPPSPPVEPPAPTTAGPSVAPNGDGRSIVQVIAEAVSDLRDGDGKPPTKAK